MNKPASYARRLCLCSIASLLCLGTVGASAQITSGVLSAMLQPTQETPPILASSAFGNAFLNFDVASSMLCYSITYSDLGAPNLASGEISAHIHGPAEPGSAAGILFGISPSPSPVGSPKEGCVGPLSVAERTDLVNGLLYINIHSNAFPGGEIRGQILFEQVYP